MKIGKRLLLLLLLIVLLAGCQTTDSNGDKATTETPADVTFEPGTYTGKAEGHNGDISVEVEFSEDKILSIQVGENDETEHVAKLAFERIPAQIIEEQSLQTDAVTGATTTSSALRSAVANAVKEAGADPAPLYREVEKERSTKTVELEADVVVVGGGSGGLAAALSAEQNGLSVILLEKNAMLGGHSAFSGGLTLVTGSKIQKELGVTDDTPELAYEDMFINGGEKSVPELLDLYSQNMAESTDWVIDYANAPVPDQLTKLGENRIDRGLFFEGGGAGLIAAMAEKLEETTVDLYLDTKATGLITENDAVAGVEAEGIDGTTYTIKAKSTVLATGSYAARKDLLPDRLDNFVYYGAALSSGDGLEYAQAIGADTVNMGYVELFENGVEWLPGIAKSTYNGSMAAWNQSGILVDRQGNRVVNERGSGISIVKQQEAQDDSILFLLMDSATFDTFRNNIAGTGISQGMLDTWLENNGEKGPIFANADTIEEVAEIAGVDAAGLQSTIQRYNGFVAAGDDEDFDRPAEFMTAEIGEGPYYLVEQRPRYATTLGGLLINTNLEVINTEGNPIPGLYAVGDTAGGVRGDDSVPGADIGWALASGYLVGNHLAELE